MIATVIVLTRISMMEALPIIVTNHPTLPSLGGSNKNSNEQRMKNPLLSPNQKQLNSIFNRRKRSHERISTNVASAVVVTDGAERTDENANDVPGKQQPHVHSQSWGMTIALCTSYFTVMGAKCALPSVLSLLLSPDTGLTFPATTITNGTPQQMMSQQLTIATLSVALGKLILGPIIDYYGGKQSLQVALFSLFTCLLVISVCQSFYVFGAAWILVDFIFSACWPACISTIHEYYTSPTDWSTQIGYLAAAARAGNTVAFLLFATIIHIVTKHVPYIQQSWRPVFFVAAGIQLIPFTLLSIYGKSNDRNKRITDPSIGTVATNVSRSPNIASTVTSVLRREVRHIDFWFHLINRSMLMIYGSFLLFVPTYMTQIFRTTNTYGAQIGSFYAMGCLLSVTTLSKYYPTMLKRTKLLCITILLLFGATGTSLLQLAHVSGYIHLNAFVGSILLFIWGFSFAVPFYIPPSLYALSRGGTSTKTSSSQSSTATITDIFDIGGFALLAIFNGYVTGINHSQLSAWIPTFAITTSCAVLSYLALFMTTWRE